MKADPLPPIPVSPRVVWGQFRQRVLPVCIFLGLVALTTILWERVNNAPSLAGVAEGMRALVNSPQAGLVMELKVQPYQLVNRGEVVAVIQPTDPRMPLELLQAEVQLARMRHEPSLAEQNAMDYQRVRVECLKLKAELAIARVNLVRAENDLKRNLPLYKDKVISEDVLDLSQQTRDAFKAEVTEKEQSVSEMERRLEQLRSLGDPMSSLPDDRLDSLLTRLEAEQSRAASNWGSLTLYAPLTGMVAPVFRHAGEIVQEGEPVVAIQSLESDRVIAYLRQPYPIDPKIGMRVKVTTRNRTRQELTLSVTQVGAQVEQITNALAFVRQGTLMDVGLPIVMELPVNSQIRPGELVDITLLSVPD